MKLIDILPVLALIVFGFIFRGEKSIPPVPESPDNSEVIEPGVFPADLVEELRKEYEETPLPKLPPAPVLSRVERWKRIQEAIGAETDGVPGNETIRKLEEYLKLDPVEETQGGSLGSPSVSDEDLIFPSKKKTVSRKSTSSKRVASTSSRSRSSSSRSSGSS